MKKFMKWMFIGIMALALGAGSAVLASEANGGPFVGVAQNFAGPTDAYIGYAFVGQTSSFTAEFEVSDLLGSGFLVDSLFGFGFLYEYDARPIDLGIYADFMMDDENRYFEAWEVGGRAELLVLPNPCDEPGPCYNPDLTVFVEAGIKVDIENSIPFKEPLIWGEVGFEVFF